MIQWVTFIMAFLIMYIVLHTLSCTIYITVIYDCLHDKRYSCECYSCHDQEGGPWAELMVDGDIVDVGPNSTCYQVKECLP